MRLLKLNSPQKKEGKQKGRGNPVQASVGDMEEGKKDEDRNESVGRVEKEGR